jgi:hypothetical protein
VQLTKVVVSGHDEVDVEREEGGLRSWLKLRGCLARSRARALSTSLGQGGRAMALATSRTRIRAATTRRLTTPTHMSRACASESQSGRRCVVLEGQSPHHRCRCGGHDGNGQLVGSLGGKRAGQSC